MRLFRLMKNEGLNPDIIAYNAVFNALKRAKQVDTAYAFWDEMRGGETKSSSTAKRAAGAAQGTSPDIITLTDLISTLSGAEGKGDRSKVDEVFADAVARGIFFSNFLDSSAEVDLSGMSFPVARAATRFALYRTVELAENGDKVTDLSFITGVGAAGSNKARKDKNQGRSLRLGDAEFGNKNKKTMSLRDYIQQVLRDDFHPPINSFVPKRAQGTIEIDRSVLHEWIKSTHA